MMGPEGAAELVRAWLTDRLPARLRIIEQALTLPANTLADPAKIVAQEEGPLGLEDWPAVFVLPQQMTGMTLTEVNDDASEVYRCVYSVRVLAWCRSEGYEATDRLRKRYVLAIREALLERKSLVAPQTYGSGTYGITPDNDTIDPNSMREDYSDVMTDQAKRTIAGAILDLNLITSETLPGPDSAGAVQGFDVTATHPGLD